MPGAILNIISNSNINKILTGNPEKTFFKKVYSKYTNFAIQRLTTEYGEITNLKLAESQEFTFNVQYLGDSIIETFFYIKLPDIFSPIFTMPNIIIEDDNYSCINIPEVHPFEFKWIEDIGCHLIEKIEYLFDGRVVQSYSGKYILFRNERDLSQAKLNNFKKSIGHEKNIYDPANAYDRNGNYPNVSFYGLSELDLQNLNANSAEPSIRGRGLFIPVNIWGAANSVYGIPVVSLQYSLLQVKVTCRPLYDLFRIRNIDYYFNYLSLKLKNNEMNYEFYDPPYTRANPNDPRTRIFYFLQTPKFNSIGIGDNIGNLILKKQEFEEFLNDPQNATAFYKKLGDLLDILRINHYTNIGGTWEVNIRLLTYNVFMDQDERRWLASNPQQYLITKVHEEVIKNICGDFKIKRTNSSSYLKSLIFFFNRSDNYLRNEWSNLSNWSYNNIKPYPSILTGNLIANLGISNYFNSYFATPCKSNCPNRFGLAELCLSGPVRPQNQHEILRQFTIEFDKFRREEYMESGIYNLTEKYVRNSGFARLGVYCYTFALNSDLSEYNPSGGINTRKYNSIEYVFSTIIPYTLNNLYKDPSIKSIDNSVNMIRNCTDNYNNCDNVNELERELNKDVENVCPTKIPNHLNIYGSRSILWSDLEYNFDFNIIEESVNIILYSGGFVQLLFP